MCREPSHRHPESGLAETIVKASPVDDKPQ
jgi:hypothetical protein